MPDRITLLKNLAIGFLPVLVFILAEYLFGLTIGLLVAIGFGAVELVWVYWREKRVERFILLDVGLILALGIISVLLQNDIFFKLKPALIEAILVVLLAITAFSNSPMLINMMSRYSGGIPFSAEQMDQMQGMMRRMFWLLAVHTGLIVYAAFYMSTNAWGFISGGLFYIALAVLMLVELVRTRYLRQQMQRQAESEEWFDILTPEGNIIGRAPRSQVHGNPEMLHAVVHVHVVNCAGEIFVQKRAESKDLFPGYWDTAVGGHVHSGETIEAALKREAREELGIRDSEFEPLFRYIHRNEHESELVFAFLLRSEGPFEPDRNELAGGRFRSVRDIEQHLGQGVFTPIFEREFAMLRQTVLKSVPGKNRAERRRKR